MNLHVTDVSKHYGSVRALDGVSMEIAEGEIHAVCGHNGAGKSTLVKILSGVVQPDDGGLSIDGQPVEFKTPVDAQLAGIALVDQELSLVPELTVLDNILLGRANSGFFTRPRSSRPRARALLDRVGLKHISPSAMLEGLSIGERQLVEIARALSRDAGLVILDEPTATLSDAEIDYVFAAVRDLAAAGSSIVFVSHRLSEVLTLCDTATVLRDGKLVGTKPVSELDRASLITMMIGDVHEETVARDTDFTDAERTLKVSGLEIAPRVANFSLRVSPGEIVGIAGQVGCGASEVLRALAGLEPRAQGAVTVADEPLSLGSPMRSAKKGVVYISSDRKGEGLFLGRSVSENLVATRLKALSQGGVVSRRQANSTASHLAEVSGVTAGRLDAPVGSLSGGNQQKVFLGRCLERDGTHVLLLDEPTRGVDVGGRAEIHTLIQHAAASGNAVVFCSTELDEILDLSDVVVTMFAGRMVSVRRRADVTAASVVAEMTHRDGNTEVEAA
jgi:ABC-type sugar transport system ATPase subunit